MLHTQCFHVRTGETHVMAGIVTCLETFVRVVTCIFFLVVMTVLEEPAVSDL